MSKRTGVILFLLLAALFLVVNRGAYHGYFQDDEIDNLSWAPYSPATDYLKGVLTPLFYPNNFRPVGHFYFHELEHFARLDFPKYVLVLHLFHLLNVWLVWLLARRLGAEPFAAAAGCAFFAFHMALFDAVWKPMYVFDVLCATFCLLSLLAFSRQRWILSFLSFWLAYKCKEMAVMLPLALAGYEYWFGKRRWKPLAPFFLISLSFGLQGMLLNPNKDNDYTFRFTPAALAATSVFYAGRVFLIPCLGFGLAAAAFLARNRRTWFGLTTMALFFLPMLFLPGRLFSAYCYLPFTGLAIAFAGIAEARKPVVVLVFFALWLPVDLIALSRQQRETLAKDNDARAYFATVKNLARTAPDLASFVYSGAPEGFHPWGIEGVLKYVYQRLDLQIHAMQDPESSKAAASGRTAFLTWNPGLHRLRADIVAPAPGDLAYIGMTTAAPGGQLLSGWYDLEGEYRWTAPTAVARLGRPAEARGFELRVNVGQELLRQVGPVTVRISLDDLQLGPHRFTEPGWQVAHWDLDSAPAGPVRVTIRTDRPFQPPHDSRTLGIAVGAFGFL